ncbi:MAG: hypothetical protein HUU10_13050 [Bacteroidetes bacterium]|nr:hypothetical protein [Bacteroidota bacterium]
MTHEHIQDDCRRIIDEMCERMGEDMTSPHCRELMKHVEDCPDCKAYLQSLKKTVKVFHESKVSLPLEVQNQLLSTLLAHRG